MKNFSSQFIPDIWNYFSEFEERRIAAGIKRHHLTVMETKATAFSELKNLSVRYLPKEFASPRVIWISGDCVAQILWDDLIAFMTKNRKIAEDYRKYFKFLWNNSEK